MIGMSQLYQLIQIDSNPLHLFEEGIELHRRGFLNGAALQNLSAEFLS